MSAAGQARTTKRSCQASGFGARLQFLYGPRRTVYERPAKQNQDFEKERSKWKGEKQEMAKALDLEPVAIFVLPHMKSLSAAGQAQTQDFNKQDFAKALES